MLFAVFYSCVLFDLSENMGGDKFGHQMKLCDNTFAVQFIMWIETVLLHMTFGKYTASYTLSSPSQPYFHSL